VSSHVRLLRSAFPFLLSVVLLAAAPAGGEADPFAAVRGRALAPGGLAPVEGVPSVALRPEPVDPRAEALAERLREPFGALWRARVRALTPLQPATPEAYARLRSALDDLEQRAGTPVEVRLRGSGGPPAMIRGGVLHAAPPAQGWDRTSDERIAREFLRANRTLLQLGDPDQELALTRHDIDQLGRRNLRFAQTYRGLPVWPADLRVHLDPAGNVDLLNGAFVPTPRTARTRPVVDAATAVTKAQMAVPGIDLAAPAPASLLIYAPGDRPPRLAWRVELPATLHEQWVVLVDALNGAILTRFNQVMDANVAGSGVDLFGTARPLNVFAQGATFFMVDTSKLMFDATSAPPNPATTRGAISILDAANQGDDRNLPAAAPVTSASAAGGFLPDAVSAAFNFGQTYDYYLERHGRNSLDGRGGSITAIVRVGRGLFNAFFLNDQQIMIFGDAAPFAGALDVVAHELTHGVTFHSAGLIYQDQPGAMNEAFSDIFGELVEARTFGAVDWITGVQIEGGLRNLKNPGAKQFAPGRPYPSTMSQFLPATDSVAQRDHGGVHINSSIINRAFFLLAEGLPQAIGLDDAGRIFYRALTVHLVQNSQFIDLRLACIQSATEIFGAGSRPATKCAEAFDGVEIFDNVATPLPPTLPPVQGGDATLFVYRDFFSGSFFLGRQESGLGDPPQGVALARGPVRATRASVTADGSIAAFVNAFSDLCLVLTDGSEPELCLGFPGLVSSVAMSPEGERFAFVFLDAFGFPTNQINLIDISPGGQTRTFTLQSPALDGSSPVDAVLFADAMDFTADGRVIVYDALSELRLAGGSRIALWSIYAIDLQTERTFALVPPVPGLDIGFPSLSQTSDDFVTFAASESATGRFSVFVQRLSTGTVSLVAQGSGTLGVPGFTGDDGAVVFSEGVFNSTGALLLRQALGSDRQTPVGSPSLLLAEGDAGVPYRRGVAPSTTQVSLSATQFRAGGRLTVGIKALNPPSGVDAELFIGAVLPDGRTVAFFGASGQVTALAPLASPAAFRAIQVAPPGFILDAPAFFRLTFPATGIAPGTYQVFAALVRKGALVDNRLDPGDILGFDIRALTFTP
jgi:Zn-dependent metalloprotease